MMAVLPSAWTSWVEAETFAPGAPSEWSDWVEGAAASGVVSPSEWSDWVEATAANGGDLPSEWSEWVEGTTFKPSTIVAYRNTPGGPVALGTPMRRTPAGTLVPLFGGSHGPDVPPVPRVVASAWSNWVVASTTPASQLRKPMMGVIGSSNATFDAINAQVGPVVIRRTYNTTLPSSWAASNAAPDVAANRMSYWSWKPSVTGFPTSDSQKAAFSAFLDTIPAGHEAVIMAWHEPEDDIAEGSYTITQWGALQNAVATIIKSKNRPELRTGFCLMGQYTFDARSGRHTWPWTTAVNMSLIDVVGIDPYRMIAGSTMDLETLLTVRNSGTGTGSAPSTMQVLESWGKPIAIMEWGAWSSTDASVATYVTNAYAWMKEWNQGHPATPIESALWFNYNLNGSATLLNGPSVTAYRAAVVDSKIPV